MPLAAGTELGTHKILALIDSREQTVGIGGRKET